jgi:hypothetical protein
VDLVEKSTARAGATESCNARGEEASSPCRRWR